MVLVDNPEAPAMNDAEHEMRRRRLIVERYHRLAAPFVARMVELRILWTQPHAGGAVWTNTEAERLYATYEETLKTLM